jgi:hypothetical protein
MVPRRTREPDGPGLEQTKARLRSSQAGETMEDLPIGPRRRSRRAEMRLPGTIVAWLAPLTIAIADGGDDVVERSEDAAAYLTLVATLLLLLLIGVGSARSIRDVVPERRYVLWTLLATMYVSCAAFLIGIRTHWGPPLGAKAAVAPLAVWLALSLFPELRSYAHVERIDGLRRWHLPNLANPWGRVVAYVTVILGAAMLAFLVIAPNPSP